MTALNFVPSKPFTLGVECELQLLDRESLDLVDGIVPLLEIYPGNLYVKPEFIQNTVEIATKICESAAEVEADLRRIALELRENALRIGMRLCSAGTHPFCQRQATITPLPRYQMMERESGYISHNQITYATHVHVGMASGEDAIYVMRRLKSFLPLLIGVSANSPFWRGFESDFASYRHRILSASRSYGIPPSFESWGQFNEFFTAVSNAGIFNHVHDIHWDIRPCPRYGTVEVRVMDAQTTIGEAAMLAALIHVLAVYLLRQKDSFSATLVVPALPWWLEKENHYQATRLGMAANFVYSPLGEIKPLRTVWFEIFQDLMTVASELGEADYLEQLNQKVIENTLGYIRQREVFQGTGSLLDVVSALVDQFDCGLEIA
jgi:glutamate---cysteine ligase / carboxylate-amine ligase